MVCGIITFESFFRFKILMVQLRKQGFRWRMIADDRKLKYYVRIAVDRLRAQTIGY